MVSQPSTVKTQVFRVELQNLEENARTVHGTYTVRQRRLFFLQGDLSIDEARLLCKELLVDPVVETFTLSHEGDETAVRGQIHTVDVTFLPGVTDSAAQNFVHAAHELGVTGLIRAATGSRYLIEGDVTRDELVKLAESVFANVVIQRYAIDETISAPFVEVQATNDVVEIIALKNADDDTLMAISKERRLSLDLNEMRAIREYFASEDRDPTDAELEMLAQTWSEHCVHKTFRAKIDYTGPDGEQETIDGILKTYLRAATEKVNKPWVRSAFVDNAGIIKFDDVWDIAFKAETHNRPSAIEPFGGANTGAGGVIRDVLGVSARPIANTDILCFGLPDMLEEDLPQGVLHPKRIAEGVIAGIEDYGNKMGIPTVNGAIHYHPGYTSNPLVFAGCVGILPHGSHRTEAQAGDLIVVIGGRTGRDGLRGATFSSMEMDTTTSTVSGGAVQIGNPIEEKQVQEVVLKARDEGLYTAITDCGAGGLSSAVGEMGEKLGAKVQLETIPLKYPGLQPWEIWLSEAQERMVLAVPQENWERLQAICAGQDVEATAIGTYEGTGRLTLHYGKKLVGDLSMHFLHDGIPQRHMQAEWKKPDHAETTLIEDENFSETLLKLLAMPTIRSKEEVIRLYDHEVQGGTAIKPLVGRNDAGPSDATVIVPLDTQGEGTTRGFALSVGMCPQYTELDPYAMAWAAIDEAIRNLVAVGADPDQIAILDNFSWGNTNLPDRLGSLVRCAQGCHDAAIAYGVPFISGKDSLNNEYLGADGERHAIPGTLVISAVGIVPDVTKTVTMDLKKTGNLLFVIGETRNEMGGSHYDLLHNIEGGKVPQPKDNALKTYRALYKAMQSGLVRSCHDVSEGGIAVALAEMSIAGGLGADINVCGLVPGLQDTSENPLPVDKIMCFGETTSRFIVEVRQDRWAEFEAFCRANLSESDFIGMCGRVTDSPMMTIGGCEDNKRINLALADLERAWRGEAPVPSLESIPIGLFDYDFDQKTVIAHNMSTRAHKPKVLILHANGTNRDRDALLACELAGGEPEIVHVNQLVGNERALLDYHMLVVPGGFSYGDDLGAGMLWAQDLRRKLGADLQKFIADGRPVLGICNGFQTLVKAGILPDANWSPDAPNDDRPVTLTYNQNGHFECRWVYLEPVLNSPCLFTQDLNEPIHCPVAHGEGRVVARDNAVLQQLLQDGLAPLIYVDHRGKPASYPFNPNGSSFNIAGLCNPAGNVFGLMPHPENHVFPWQHPRYRRGEKGMDGLRLFKNGIKFA